MAVNGISGLGITGTLSNGKEVMDRTVSDNDARKFSEMIKVHQKKVAMGLEEGISLSGVSSGQVAKNHRLNGDYKQGFYDAYTSDRDRNAAPTGFAAASRTSGGKAPVIDKTSDLYAQSMEMENFLVKMMLSSMRETVQHTSLSGEDNSYARKMYEDMMYENISESVTKNAGLGLADQIYIELSGQR